MDVDIDSLETLNLLTREGAQAANEVLEEMVDAKTVIEITKIMVADRANVVSDIQRSSKKGIQSSITGAFSGTLLFAFDEACLDTVSEMLVGEGAGEDLSRDGVMELANVMRGGFLTGWGDYLETGLDATPPTYLETEDLEALEVDAVGPDTDSVLFFQSAITWRGERIGMDIYLIPDRQAIETLLEADIDIEDDDGAAAGQAGESETAGGDFGFGGDGESESGGPFGGAADGDDDQATEDGPFGGGGDEPDPDGGPFGGEAANAEEVGDDAEQADDETEQEADEGEQAADQAEQRADDAEQAGDAGPFGGSEDSTAAADDPFAGAETASDAEDAGQFGGGGDEEASDGDDPFGGDGDDAFGFGSGGDDEPIEFEELDDREDAGTISLEKLSVFSDLTAEGTKSAAERVTTMTGVETGADVAGVSFTPVEDIPDHLEDGEYVGTTGEFEGLPSGHLVILFDESSAKNIAEAMMPMEPPGDDDGLTDMHESAIEELANIMTSGFIDGWANVLETSVDHTPPEFAEDMEMAFMNIVTEQLGTFQTHAFSIESAMRTDDLDFTCKIHALPDEEELGEALEELLIQRKDETEADPDDLF